MNDRKIKRRFTKAENNQLLPIDRPVHDWYRFVLSFPPHLVRDYLEKFNIDEKQQVLDPFCGTGTTVVECKKLGIPSVGIEANRMAHFAANVKINWNPDPDGLLEHANQVAASTLAELESSGISDAPLLFNHDVLENGRGSLRMLDAEQEKLLLTNSISPLPLHKTLVLLDHMNQLSDDRYRAHELLALAKALVGSISNLRFGPEVGVGAIKDDAPVVEPWLSTVRVIAADLRTLQEKATVPAVVHYGDARQAGQLLSPESIDAVITSPPYPNEKDYTRTTRLESVLLGFLKTKADLRELKQGLMRSNTRNVYKGDDDDKWVAEHPEVQEIADRIEARRIELGKTSGFEKLYARVTKLYFGGMARHLADLRSILRPGAQLAYVVGDQASYLQVMIRTGQLIADIATALGYDVVGIDLFRTRLATATRKQLREEVVILRWPGVRTAIPFIQEARRTGERQDPGIEEVSKDSPPESEIDAAFFQDDANAVEDDVSDEDINNDETRDEGCEISDGTIGALEFSDDEESDDSEIVKVSRFRLTRRDGRGDTTSRSSGRQQRKTWESTNSAQLSLLDQSDLE